MARSIDASQLGEAQALSDLSPAALAAVAAEAQCLNFEQGETVIRHLDQDEDLYVILTGSVRVNLLAPGGRELTYQILPRGEMFGELAAIDKLDRSSSVMAEEAACLARIEGRAFRALVLAHPEFAMVILERMARLSRRLIQRLFEYHAYNVKGRVIAEVLRLTDSHALPPQVTDRDMASRVGTTRENVTRTFSNLKELGIISREQGQISVLDRARLERALAECEFS